MLESVPLAEVVSDEAKLSYLVRSCDYLQRQDRERYLPDVIGLLRRMLRESPSDLRVMRRHPLLRCNHRSDYSLSIHPSCISCQEFSVLYR